MAGFGPLRKDAPGRSGRSRGSLPALDSEVERSNALDALDDDVYAVSSRTAQASLWKTIQAALAKFGLPPFPPSVDSVEALGAAL